MFNTKITILATLVMLAAISFTPMDASKLKNGSKLGHNVMKTSISTVNSGPTYGKPMQQPHSQYHTSGEAFAQHYHQGHNDDYAQKSVSQPRSKAPQFSYDDTEEEGDGELVGDSQHETTFGMQVAHQTPSPEHQFLQKHHTKTHIVSHKGGSSHKNEFPSKQVTFGTLKEQNTPHPHDQQHRDFHSQSMSTPPPETSLEYDRDGHNDPTVHEITGNEPVFEGYQ